MLLSRKRAYAESPDDEAADPTDGKVDEDAWIAIFYDEERIPPRSSKQRRKRRMKRAHWIILFEAMAIGGWLLLGTPPTKKWKVVEEKTTPSNADRRIGETHTIL